MVDGAGALAGRRQVGLDDDVELGVRPPPSPIA